MENRPRDLSLSLAMQARARVCIPGMTQLLSKRPDRFSLGVWPGYFSRAQGVEVWDLDGNRYLDMSIAGIGANILGYGDPEVDEAVRRAIADGVSSSLNCPEEVELAELLCEIHPWAQMVRFTRAGGEAMAVAVRIARAHTGRDLVAFCGYHGWHDWYLAANLASGTALEGHLMPGLSPRGVPAGLAGTALPFRYNQLPELEAICARHGASLAAVVMEPIRNDTPAPGFLAGVRDLAAKNGAVFIFDEISAGFRLCSGGAHLILGVAPDLAVFSKALGNGYAIGAVIGRAEVMAAAQESFISSTCWTERLGPAAALATVRKHRACQAADHLVRVGGLVQEGWRKAAARHGLRISVGGIPPLSHFAFQDSLPQQRKALFVQMMLDRGCLASTLFYAMYAHQEEHVTSYLRLVDECFGELATLGDEGVLLAALRGQPASAGFARLI
ncbi:MAG: aminotransferase class III-fold pyridoxal phosphate-dependent enzyme [Thermodesulfobacteriota bacterium]